MKRTLIRFTVMLICIMLIPTISFSQSGINKHNKYSYAANVGWINWQGDITNGADFNYNYATGYIYSANVGWISLGDGSPENGTSYSNTTSEDFGVNVDSTSDPEYFLLSGLAYSANCGWINFDIVTEAGAEYRPRINKRTNIMEGYLWGANIGWISLNSPGLAQVEVNFPLTGSKTWFMYK